MLLTEKSLKRYDQRKREEQKEGNFLPTDEVLVV